MFVSAAPCFCFSRSAESACGSVSIWWSKTNKFTPRHTFPLCYAVLFCSALMQNVFFFPDRDNPCIAWCGLSRSIPVLLFFPEAAVSKDGDISSTGGTTANKVGGRIDIWRFRLAKISIFPCVVCLLRELPHGLQDCAHREPLGTRNTHQSRIPWGNLLR